MNETPTSSPTYERHVLIDPSDRAAYVALALTPGIGIARIRALLAACTTAHGALSAPFEFLCSVPGLSRAAATALQARSPSDGERALAEAEALGALALVPGDAAFPTRLLDIPDAPPLLFARGRLDLLDQPGVAIVGSRDHSDYGSEVCRMLASAAAAAGIVVVSGMARGLDAVAHQAALDVGGPTIGVLGNGLGVVYPAANRELYQRVGTEGLLLSEFQPGERPHAGSFPRRNRLISGLAKVTVVVEAAIGSGALITAGTALDQGGDVMAVPGPITSSTSTGTNSLIRDGAEPLLSVEDLLAHFPGVVAASARDRKPPAPTVAPLPKLVELPADLSDEVRAIAACIGAQLIQVDAIALKAERPIVQVLIALSELEMLGVIRQHPGRMFARATAWTQR